MITSAVFLQCILSLSHCLVRIVYVTLGPKVNSKIFLAQGRQNVFFPLVTHPVGWQGILLYIVAEGLGLREVPLILQGNLHSTRLQDFPQKGLSRGLSAQPGCDT